MAVNHARRPTAGVQDPSELRRIILEAVPVGSPIDAARAFLEEQGFHKTDWPKSVDSEAQGRGEGPDRLWFRGKDGSTVKRVWNVAVDHHEGRVTDVQAQSPGLVGP